jgi:hypothetical protein
MGQVGDFEQGGRVGVLLDLFDGSLRFPSVYAPPL